MTRTLNGKILADRRLRRLPPAHRASQTFRQCPLSTHCETQGGVSFLRSGEEVQSCDYRGEARIVAQRIEERIDADKGHAGVASLQR